nr:hypothetical protein [Tanacetum cinerariifolium]
MTNSLLKDVAHALAYMHHDCNPPIVHTDISSNNILLNSEMEGFVAAARLLDPDSSNQTVVAGTLGYIAPARLLDPDSSNQTVVAGTLGYIAPGTLIENEIIRVGYVALSCVLKDPKARPTMREVCQELSC